MLKKIVAFLIFVLLPLCITAQEADMGEKNSPVNEIAETEATEEPVKEAVDGELDITELDEPVIPLEDYAIIKDVETSSLEELNNWAESLGLPRSKNIESQKSAILKHYKLKASVKEGDSDRKKINIERAEFSSYYTLEEVDESIAEFEGRVNILIDDKKNETQHGIIADKINFNRTLNSVTAYGNVEYTKTEKGQPELVTAESLTFKLSNWQGSMLKCVSKQKKTIEEEEMDFYYITGEIKKSDSDVMGMKKVSIQTVTGSPYFNITSYDFWMLEPSEFLMVSPFIKIGHVPVLWVPFYYHTENSLYFNPAYGYRNREGTVFQNTIYLVGKKDKKEEESDFSFLSFQDDEGSNVKELNGLSLVSSDDKTQYSDDFLKIMADYYSRLGIYMGTLSSFSFDPYVTKLNIDLGMAFSRNIDESNGNVFFEDDNSRWNSSYFMGDEVPFRYMLSMEFDTSIISGNIMSVSDSYFTSDFYDREENFMWVDHFTSQLDDGVEGLSDSGSNSFERVLDDDKKKEIVSYSWGFSFTSFKPDLPMLKPYLNTIVFDVKDIKFDFKRKENTTDILSPEDPAKYFFYPEKSKIPLSLSLSGDLLDSSYTKPDSNAGKKFEYKPDNPLLEIDNPYVEDNETDNDNDNTEDGEDVFKLDPLEPFEDIKSELFVSNSGSFYTNKLSYTINMPLEFSWINDPAEWERPEEINYDLRQENLLYQMSPNSSVNYNLNMFNSLITLNDKADWQMYHRSYADEDAHTEAEVIATRSWSKTNLNNKLTLQLNPLMPLNNIQYHEFNVVYSLDKLVYSKSYDSSSTFDNPEYEENTFEWTDDYVKDNSITANYKYNLGYSISALSYEKKLAPVEEDYTATAKQNFNVDYYDFNFKADGEISYSESFTETENSSGQIVDSGEDAWDKKPINASLNYKPTSNILLTSAFKYNLEDEKVEDISGSIFAWPLTIKINSTYAKEKEWRSDSNSWKDVDGSEESVRLNNIVSSINISNWEHVFWKNRVKMNVTTNLSYDKRFIEVNDSNMLFDIKFNFDIYKFLTLSLSSQSENKSMFLYSRKDREKVGVEGDYNVFRDLARSFDLTSEKNREESFFNLKRIKFETIYKMPDWNLIFSYSGSPELNDSKEYYWDQIFSFFIEWKPLSMVRSNIKKEDEKWSVTTAPNEE